MKKIIFLFLNLILCFHGFAIEPPILQCIAQLVGTGRLCVTWDWNDTSNVQATDVYTFFVNGTQHQSINPYSNGFITSYVIQLPSSQISNNYTCYIKARNTTTGDTCISNEISTIQLTVTPYNLAGDSTAAYLQWDAVSSSTTGGSWDTVYYIYKKRAFEADFDATPIASVPINNNRIYIDPSDVCHNDISYQIGITNHDVITASGNTCIFKSNIGTILLNDSIAPQTPIFDSVSVTENNNIVLGFHAPDPFMMCYNVYYLDGGSGTRPNLSTVYNTTFWPDNSISPNDVSREYYIAVLDSCNNCSPMTEGQCNIRLAKPSTDACYRTAHISWNPYKNMSGGVREYRIFMRKNSDPSYTLMGTTTQTNYDLTNLDINTSYRVYVQACNNNNSITSSSNRVNFTINGTVSNDETHIRHVSVMGNRYISILVHTTGNLYPFSNIILQRSEDGQSFENIDTLPYHTNPEYEFMDTTAKFNKQIYYYRTYVTGNCNVPVGYSTISHNILLTGTSSSAHDCNLEWNDYGTWDGGVDHYIVSRRNEYDTSFLELPDILAPYTHNTYSDDVSMMFQSGSKFTYFVTAYEGSNSNGIGDESISNHVTLQQESSMIIANAFTPNYDGHNDVFLPSNVFVSEEGYELIIVSRYGKTMFKTTDPTAGWDGYDMRRNPAPMGVYTYIIHYVNVHGKVQQVQGSVTLIR